ncbi:MAG: 30S ribosomal protein S4 [Myxococcota bacterium]
MSRYTGPRVRVLRALNTDLPGLTRKGVKRREGRPGQHGYARRRRPSEYALQLREKQIVRHNYGVTERQLRRLFDRAKRAIGVTGNQMLAMLESRLDNVVFRAGFAATIPGARQLVNHGHVTVNGRRVDIASAELRVGDTVGLRPRSQRHPGVAECWPSPALPLPPWLERDESAKTARLVDRPTIASVAVDVDMQLVVEFYSR